MKNPPDKSGGSRAVPAKMLEKFDPIMNLIEPFCRENLNEEYLAMCRELAEVLARKRPSPLSKGTAQAWACAIIRTIGWVNYLDDNTQNPHMKLTSIDKAFGISSATGQTKSKSIRDMLKIGTFEPAWTLPSRLADNPRIWLVHLTNGMIVDVRSMPREIQEDAFHRGIIPYIPDDRKTAADGTGGIRITITRNDPSKGAD